VDFVTTLLEKQLAGIVVTLSMVVTGLVIVDKVEQTYVCEPENFKVKEFVRCSSTFKTCYDLFGKGDRCVGGIWKPIKGYYVPARIIRIYANNKWWTCAVKRGIIHRYTLCESDKEKGYLGEFFYP